MARFSGVRPPAVAGRFYPGDAEKLRVEVDGMLDAAPDVPDGDSIVGGLAPHAGYAFSGRVAARVFKALRGRAEKTVVLLGTAHYADAAGFFLPDSAAFKTPLGEIPVDTELARALIDAHPGVEVSPSAHEREHSIEVQLPFIQRALDGARILPIVTGVKDRADAAEFGRALGGVLKGKDAPLIVSSDFSHYPAETDARRSDRAALAALEKMDPDFLWDADRALMRLGIPELHCTQCGLGAAAAALSACEVLEAGICDILHYTNSSEISGDTDRVVGYGAALFRRGKRPEGPFFGLDEGEKRALIAIARESLARRLKTGLDPATAVHDAPKLNLPGAAFVTWKKRTGAGKLELRACVGTTQRDRTIANCVAHFAVRSAMSDIRFPPVAAEELPDLVAEVSVLSPPRRSSAEAIRPGQGVVFEHENARGLFLPVMWEQFPDKETFMNILAGRKAGSREDAWKDPKARLWTFEAEAFSEEE